MNERCAEVQDLLPFYAGGTLEENQRLAVEQHLLACQRVPG